MTGTLILVAKYPTPGKSKTRLIPALGKDGATQMATAMLTDLLVQMGAAPELVGVRKLLVYAPASSGTDMADLLDRTGVAKQWDLEPMLEDAIAGARLESSDLGDKLAEALKSAQKVDQTGPVAFIGMDTPDLPAQVIRAGLDVAMGLGTAERLSSSEAFITPAHDGGYTLLVVPANCPPTVFKEVEWSSSRTCSSQVYI
jgi:glycosyltransferase A (GT-A) superfamily protein (DUF2064 family)